MSVSADTVRPITPAAIRSHLKAAAEYSNRALRIEEPASPWIPIWVARATLELQWASTLAQAMLAEQQNVSTEQDSPNLTRAQLIDLAHWVAVELTGHPYPRLDAESLLVEWAVVAGVEVQG